jgi:hypothetical protein
VSVRYWIPTSFGYAVVREALTFRAGTSDNDFISNIDRFICEERLTLAVERPSAAQGHRIAGGVMKIHPELQR